jgi:Type I restriction-modification system methyltransferase subunit
LKKTGMNTKPRTSSGSPKKPAGPLRQGCQNRSVYRRRLIQIEKENSSLKGVLDKRYARPEIDKRRLGELIDLISTIKLHDSGEKDLLGRVYEYFLGQFASVEGKGGGEFYTPTSVVKTLVEMIEPYQGRAYEIIMQRLIQFNKVNSCCA